MCLTVNISLTENRMTECNNQIQIIFKINFLEILLKEILCEHIQNKTECYNYNIKEVFKRFFMCTVCDTLN